MITLPTAKSPPSTVNPRVLILYGAPKVGKTTVLAQLDDCLILDLERGTDHVSALKINVESLDHLKEIVSELHAKNRPYRYLALDTVTAMEEWCERLATDKYRKSEVGKNFTGDSVLQLPKGSGYHWLRMAFQEVTQNVASAARRLIFVGHLRDKYLEKPGVEVAAKDLDLTGKIRNIVCSRADAVGYLYRAQGVNTPLKVSFMTVDEVNCGSRCAHLGGQSFDFDWSKIYLPEPNTNKP